MIFSYGFEYSTNSLPGVFWVIWAAAMVIGIIGIVAMWRIFTKAYIPGWQSIIPFLNSYRMFQIVGMPGWLIFLVFVPVVGALVVAIASLMARFKLVKNFGGGTGLAVLSIFFGTIVMILLAFSPKYDYDGAD